MKFAISHTPSKALQKFISAVGSEGRAMLYSGAASNLGADIKRHLHLYSADHHKSAER